MNFRRAFLLAAFILFPLVCYAQQGPQAIRASPAYAEVLLRKTEMQADLEAFLADYTEQNPKILDLRFELASLSKSMERLLIVKPADAGSLTLALGKLMVKKASLDTDLARLQRSYGKEHAEVKRAVRRSEIFDSAINEILRTP